MGLAAGLNRPHIEFLQAQQLAWRRLPPGAARPDAEYKYLSRDAATGACSCLIRYPARWERDAGSTPEALAATEELYVLDGELEIDGRRLGPDHYARIPAGWPSSHRRSQRGAVVLSFFDAEPAFGVVQPGSAQPVFIDVLHEPWDMRLNDPRLAHLGLGRKNLYQSPRGDRSLLSLMLPHAEPAGAKGARETHPVVEECYVLQGSLVGPHGEMQAGAYFWRPPGIAHGPFGTRWGCVALIRFLGGTHVNEWSREEAPFDLRAPYRPVLPPELAHLAQGPALDPWPRY